MNTAPKKIWLILAALVVAALLFGISTRVASESPSELVGFNIAHQMPPTYLAYTQCTQVADSIVTISWVRTEVLGTEQENPIVAHEHVHKEQMQRFPDCGSAYRWYRTNRVEAEAEAYCESARVFRAEHPKKVTLDGAIFLYARWLKNYDRRLNHADAIAAIKKFCDG